MPLFWENILRTIMAGTDRHPVSEAALSALGLDAEGDAARAALRALPAAYLLRRAAAPLGEVSTDGRQPCAPDERPICPSAAAQVLVAVLRFDAYPAVLPEYFDLLCLRGWQLPPELVPETLDHLARKKLFTPSVRDALGPLAGWLAAQNLAWRSFFPGKEKRAKQGRVVRALPAPRVALQVLPDALPEDLWQRSVLDLARQDTLLESPDSTLVQTLLSAGHLWPQHLLHLLVEYPLRNGHARHWSPPKHLRQLLQRAALRCRPTDVLDMAPPERDWPYAWHSELVQFRGTVQFRQKMWEAFGR